MRWLLSTNFFRFFFGSFRLQSVPRRSLETIRSSRIVPRPRVGASPGRPLIQPSKHPGSSGAVVVVLNAHQAIVDCSTQLSMPTRKLTLLYAGRNLGEARHLPTRQRFSSVDIGLFCWRFLIVNVASGMMTLHWHDQEFKCYRSIAPQRAKWQRRAEWRRFFHSAFLLFLVSSYCFVVFVDCFM